MASSSSLSLSFHRSHWNIILFGFLRYHFRFSYSSSVFDRSLDAYFTLRPFQWLILTADILLFALSWSRDIITILITMVASFLSSWSFGRLWTIVRSNLISSRWTHSTCVLWWRHFNIIWPLRDTSFWYSSIILVVIFVLLLNLRLLNRDGPHLLPGWSVSFGFLDLVTVIYDFAGALITCWDYGLIQPSIFLTLCSLRQIFTISITWTLNFGLSRFISWRFLKKIARLIGVGLIASSFFPAGPWLDALQEGVVTWSQSILIDGVDRCWLLELISVVDNVALIVVRFQLIFTFDLLDIWSDVGVLILFFEEKIALLYVW